MAGSRRLSGDRALRRRDHRRAVTTGWSRRSTWRAPDCGRWCWSARHRRRRVRHRGVRARLPRVAGRVRAVDAARRDLARPPPARARPHRRRGRARRSTCIRTVRRSCWMRTRPRRMEAIRARSVADARAFPAYEATLGRIAKALMPVFDWTAPDPRMRRVRRPARAGAARAARVPPPPRPPGDVVPVHHVGAASTWTSTSRTRW